MEVEGSLPCSRLPSQINGRQTQRDNSTPKTKPFHNTNSTIPIHAQTDAQPHLKPTSGEIMPDFLDLPRKLQPRIFHEAGLPGVPGYHPIWGVNPNTGIQRSVHGEESCKWVLNLLLVFKAISREVQEIFYSNNKFTIQESAPGKLQPLYALSGLSLDMENLTIHLRVCRCRVNFGHGVSCINAQTECGKSHKQHIQPLDFARQEDSDIVMRWAALAGRLAKSAGPWPSLTVLCDTADVQTAKRIVNPLYRLPKLNEFGIRLARNHNQDLQDVANTTLYRITGHRPAPTFHGWTKLPPKLRFRILEYTGLVVLFEQDVFWHQR